MPPTTPDKAARLSTDRLEAVLAASGSFCAAGAVLPAPTLGVAALIDAVEGHTKKTCPPQIVRYLLQNGSRAAPAVWAELRGSAGILGDFAAEAPPVSEEEAAEIDLAFERISAFRVLAPSASASPDELGRRSSQLRTARSRPRAPRRIGPRTAVGGAALPDRLADRPDAPRRRGTRPDPAGVRRGAVGGVSGG